MGKAPCCDKAIVKKGPWAPEEDAILKDYIENYGTGNNWIALPQKIGINRCGKSCRLRWLNYLRPNIKHGGFSEEEDNIICSLYISIGSRWSIIAAQLPGRTDNDIKNYWNTKLKKKLLRRGKQSLNNRLSDSSKDMKDENHMENISSFTIERVQLHMQLQRRENHNTSNSANFTMWPCRLNPIQEKMIQNLQLLNESSNHLIDARKNIETYAPPNNSLPQENYSPFSNMMANGIENFIDESNVSGLPTHISDTSDTEQKRLKLQQFWAIQSEMDMFLSNETANLEFPDQVQVGELDYYMNMDSSIDNMAWWSNEFDHRSSNSLISRIV